VQQNQQYVHFCWPLSEVHVMDAEMSKLIGEHLKRIGVDVILGSKTRAIRRVNDRLDITLTAVCDAAILTGSQTGEADGT
jgi:pyruvate/2-oxoglutarate dehydrogenase complex dihydrolipoamide dehydrogenase (E3) component